MRRGHVPFLASMVLILGCGGTPETGTAVCPPPPDPRVIASIPSEPVTSGSATRGAALFERECTRCHSPQLAARGSRFFRDYPRLDCADYLAQASDPYLFLAISAGGPAIGRGELMKPFSEMLSEQEIADLVAYLESLPAK